MNFTAMDEMIKNVVDVVFYSKYYYITDRDLKEDLLQEGRLAPKLVTYTPYAERLKKLYVQLGLERNEQLPV